MRRHPLRQPASERKAPSEASRRAGLEARSESAVRVTSRRNAKRSRDLDDQPARRFDRRCCERSSPLPLDTYSPFVVRDLLRLRVRARVRARWWSPSSCTGSRWRRGLRGLGRRGRTPTRVTPAAKQATCVFIDGLLLLALSVLSLFLLTTKALTVRVPTLPSPYAVRGRRLSLLSLLPLLPLLSNFSFHSISLGATILHPGSLRPLRFRTPATHCFSTMWGWVAEGATVQRTSARKRTQWAPASGKRGTETVCRVRARSVICSRTVLCTWCCTAL
jgi:hypothetical protein